MAASEAEHNFSEACNTRKRSCLLALKTPIEIGNNLLKKVKVDIKSRASNESN